MGYDPSGAVTATADASITAGSIDITPDQSLPLAGDRDTSGLSRGIHDPLELNALLLRARGATVAILTADLLFLTEPLRERVLSQLRTALALDDASLLVAASHTHSAPSVDPSKPRLGACDPRYAELVVQRAVELLRRLAATQPVPCQLDYRAGAADHAINRRRRGWWLTPLPRRVTLRAPNPAGPRDETLHVLTFSDARARPIAMLWSYACHPVGFPQKTLVSADYPGVVRRALRAALGAELPVLFLQGFAGDVRPRELGPQRTLARRVAERVVGPLFAPFTPPQYATWAESLAATVVKVAHGTRATRQPLAPAGERLRLMLSSLLPGAPEGRSVTFQRLAFNPQLTIAAVSAEPVAAYGQALKRVFPGIVLPVGYIDTVFGYLPTAAMLGERGYEDSGFMEAFGLRGRLRPDLEELVLAAWQRLQAARPA